jgi:selenocysteine-specific elongation factor
MHVIGTAGHVDHGKSTLIAALTGVHPDRLKEEQEREMTIDLGFGWLTLPGGEQVGIVDVPGHRDFIENMLAGVGGIDAVLLVIAADEGIMPQTREHLAILDLLGIKTGLIVLSKIDLVADTAWLELVEAEVKSALRGTTLHGAQIIRVSARSRVGLTELLDSLSLLLRTIPPRPDLHRPRLPVDRVFSMTGFGTVVTGTLSDGKLRLGEEIKILPSGVSGRIRSLQTHRKNEEVALPGSRTAINIAGLNVEQIRRGQVVTHPDQYLPTHRIDVRFTLLPTCVNPIRHRTQVKFFTGTSETLTTVRLLGEEMISPGGSGWLQLELDNPVVTVRGDRFILRRPSPGETLGGGTVVDPQPKSRHKRFDKSLIAQLSSLERGSPTDVLLQAAFALGPATVRQVITRSLMDQALSEPALQELLDSGKLLLIEQGLLSPEKTVVSSSLWEGIKGSTFDTLTTFHKSFPLRRGMPREELKSRLQFPPNLFNLVINRMAAEGFLTDGQTWIAMVNHSIQFTPPQKYKIDKLMALFITSPHAPPSVKECQMEVGEEVFNALIESGQLVAVSDDVVFRDLDYRSMVDEIKRAIRQRQKLSLAEARDLLQTSRKYVQALLEYMDSAGVTIRMGDFRQLKK